MTAHHTDDQEDTHMTTDQARGERLEIRRPGDVPPFTALSRLVEQRAGHDDRLMNNRLPADHPHPVERGTAADALAGLALGEAVRRRIADEHGSRMREALELGATWSEVAAALDVAPDDARELLRAWAEGQHRLYRGDVTEGRPRPLGLDDDAHAAVLALCALDDETAAAAAVDASPVPAPVRLAPDDGSGEGWHDAADLDGIPLYPDNPEDY
ncbi:hypothetical protein OOK44_38115 [Streptomyces cellulosae]|uniref:hypothetical protein n=1 Tax=Streptomyces cellulosae TaxID=1968 RepID=UPI00225631B8|nr:hypothetical protein [Streptomyces cellulosae]MCX4482193.1 hypothetical protein [Streptomyces cellulosae]